jgi:hypothetical protein
MVKDALKAGGTYGLVGESTQNHYEGPVTAPVSQLEWLRESLTAELSGLWEKENLDKLLGDSVIRVPVVSQGLNEWRRYHTAAFLATLKLTPDQINFFKTIIPDYNPDLDRTVDQCIQFLFRSGARVAKSDKPLFFVVSDQRLAQSLSSSVSACLRTS